MWQKISFIFAAIVFSSLPVHAGDTDTLKVGDNAPDFSLPFATRDSIGESDLSLSSQIGKRSIVLAFYPADWSGGCTKEVCTLRDNFEALGQLNAEVYGISGDYMFSHHQWAKELNLPFTLLSDHTHQVAKTYNSFMETAGYNKRTVYIIDRNGKIAYIDLNYSVRDAQSFEKLKTALSSLK